jgi:hypothetical protein
VTTYACPDGHRSAADDWCDVCGAPIAAAGGEHTGEVAAVVPPAPASAAPPAGAGAGATGRPCPNCGAETLAGALFCESCGYDFTTGALPPAPDPATAPSGALVIDPAPKGPPPGPVAWVAEVWVDPDWYAAQDSEDACPSAGAPVVVPLHERSVLVGRTSASRSIHPQVDCGSDTGVSRRHAQLTTDGQRWWVEDLQSANGTYTGGAGGPLPTDALPPGQRRELAGDDRIYLGAWTRIVVRAATPDEQGA